MKYINVTTPDNIDVEYRLAGAGSRIAAVVIDNILQWLLFIIILLVSFFAVFDINSYDIIINNQFTGWYLAYLIITYFIIFFGYFLICEMLMKGQTLGKKVFKLRTIRQNGQPITLLQSITRNLLRIFIDNLGVGLFTIMFSKTNKRTGDMLAGTIVISENPDRVKTSSLLLKKTGPVSDYVLNTQYPLTTEEYELLKDYFARRDSFTDQGVSAQIKLTEYFAGKFRINPVELNEGVLYAIMMENAKSYH